MELRNVFFFHCIQFLFHLIKYDFALGGPNWGFHLRKAFELKAEGTFHCADKLVLILRISLITGVYTNPPPGSSTARSTPSCVQIPPGRGKLKR